MMRILLSASIVAIGIMGIIISWEPKAAIAPPEPQAEEVVVEELKAEQVIEERDIEQMIRWHAVSYGVDPDMAVMIAQCESGLNEYAQNPMSTAKGLYQFTDPTWEYIKATGHQFDAEQNIHQFMIWWKIHPEWWVCE